MRKLTYYVASTLDGFIAAPDGSFDFFPMGDHYATLIAEYPETFPVQARQALGITAENKHFDTVLMGRGTYEPALKIGITSPYPHLRQFVFSRSIPASLDPAVELISSSPLKRVQELKRENGKGIWLCGGGQLAQELLPEIDELIIKLNPVIIRSGIPLFAGDFQPLQFKLVSSQAYESGVVIIKYLKP